jgi:lysozyme
MSPDDQLKLKSQLKVDEGLRLYAYQDSLGYWTIGYGRLIDHRKGGQISQDEAEYLLNNDIAKTSDALAPFTWFNIQDSVRQAALVDMAVNLGVNGLLHFPHFLGHMQMKDYTNAADALINTLWHSQVGVRADRIIKMIEKGAWA